MNKLISLLLSGLLWRKYKFLLVSLILLIVCVFLIGQVHQDYLAYSQSLENPQVGWSFAIKWAAWGIAIAVFLGVNHLANKNKQRQEVLEEKNSALQRILSFKSRSDQAKSGDAAKAFANKSSKSKVDREGEGDNKRDVIDSNDPFAELRTKDKLRSYADLIIEKKSDDKR